MHKLRYQHGALSLQAPQAAAVVKGDEETCGLWFRTPQSRPESAVERAWLRPIAQLGSHLRANEQPSVLAAGTRIARAATASSMAFRR